ncbi:MAG: quinone-dependent dihydroorotate dehydrogenase [Hyphomicrobiales bacterium]|nr:quinone-dependent dihydroorotate dehydrogenase [Hyphomicrobiales bacterium]MDE2115216.1 quinone-dependent dihydroorotate dehydrogenase [Hyphomicrobiales bacterium]
MDFIGTLAGPMLQLLEPERAHQATIRALQYLPLPAPPQDDPALQVEAFGLSFPNPIGMAAGFDKNAQVYAPLLQLGFGFTEIGTVTPLAQPGNPKPRIFRLPEQGAVINRLGFNGEGHGPALARLQAHPPRGIVGVNIGANKLSADRVDDYVRGIEAFSAVATYFTVNISSPNTPGLRDLQGEAELDRLLGEVMAARAKSGHNRPILLKIAPDLSLDALDAIVATARRHQLQGMIISNTTLARPGLVARNRYGTEAGGLSGKPLFEPSTTMLAQAYVRVEQQFPLVGVGGVDSAATAYAKITAGAALVQLYTGMIYQGLGLVGDIKRGLVQSLQRDGHTTIGAAVGTKAPYWLRQ